MRPGPRKVTAAAALLSVAALAGCGLSSGPPATDWVTPPPASQSPPVAVVAPPPSQERAPLSPPLEVPMPPVPTVQGPYVPIRPTASATPTTLPTPAPSSTPSPAPTATPTPAPADLVALLPRATGLPPLTWVGSEGEQTAQWSEVAAPAVVQAATAITHVAAARAAGGECASIADRVDGAALAAAAGSFAADPAPGAPFDLVLLQYPAAADATDALAALRSLGTACAGVVTDQGVLGAAASGRAASGAVTLVSGEATLTVEATVRGGLLVAVLHEGAPPDAVAALLASVG